MNLYMSTDMYYILILVPVFIFSVVAQIRVNSTFKKYSNVLANRGITGAQAAAEILKMHNINNVGIQCIQGKLNDHYDPAKNTIFLSEAVCNSRSIAAIGVAAHEAGHAVQYAVGYKPIKFRAMIIPATQLGSNLAIPLIFIGLIFNMFSLFILGIIFFSAIAFFQLVTLPVEFNASSRAINSLRNSGILDSYEISGAKSVLTAAAMTYVAALAVSLANILRFVLIANRRR